MVGPLHLIAVEVGGLPDSSRQKNVVGANELQNHRTHLSNLVLRQLHIAPVTNMRHIMPIPWTFWCLRTSNGSTQYLPANTLRNLS